MYTCFQTFQTFKLSNFQTFQTSNFQTIKVWEGAPPGQRTLVQTSKVWKFESLKVWTTRKIESLKVWQHLQFDIDNRASILGASTNYKIFIFPNEAEENHQVFLLFFTAAAIWCIHTRRPAALRPDVVIDYTRLQLL